jgi:hypothetical protein
MYCSAITTRFGRDVNAGDTSHNFSLFSIHEPALSIGGPVKMTRTVEWISVNWNLPGIKDSPSTCANRHRFTWNRSFEVACRRRSLPFSSASADKISSLATKAFLAFDRGCHIVDRLHAILAVS